MALSDHKNEQTLFSKACSARGACMRMLLGFTFDEVAGTWSILRGDDGVIFSASDINSVTEFLASYKISPHPARSL